MRVIDGDHLKSILQEYVKREEAYAESGNFFDNLISTCVAAGLLEAIHSIEEEPSAQPEIIRCRECKHYDGRPCGIVDWYNTADDFCSMAERKGEENE